ncbi:hypothetical protein F7725_018196 [Dissostichus mawsoni]|uniref:Uncharacterized protein n=1 Tax=Dissostichus mawsoni TaxID=36200 RepID=A0A7J5XSG1_DISMA|nr:hypothetical protein F7725_018196 [Dissostichus mawsoni]
MTYCQNSRAVQRPNGASRSRQRRLEDYENISTAHSAVSPNPLNDDTDTSEDELEINYSQVNFKARLREPPET